MDIPNLRQKADSGNVVAQSILGNCYPEGVEVGVDDEEAFRLLSSAAGQGASRDKANLARMHAEGLGVLKSLPEAIRLYERQRKRESSLLRSALPGFIRKGWACQQNLARPLSRTLRQPLKRIGSPTAKNCVKQRRMWRTPDDATIRHILMRPSRVRDRAPQYRRSICQS